MCVDQCQCDLIHKLHCLNVLNCFDWRFRFWIPGENQDRESVGKRDLLLLFGLCGGGSLREAGVNMCIVLQSIQSCGSICEHEKWKGECKYIETIKDGLRWNLVWNALQNLPQNLCLLASHYFIANLETWPFTYLPLNSRHLDIHPFLLTLQNHLPLMHLSLELELYPLPRLLSYFIYCTCTTKH